MRFSRQECESMKTDEDYLQKMLEYIRLIGIYTDRVHRSGGELVPNDQLSDGVAYKFMQLREESKKISPELLLRFPDFEAQIHKLNGFRNRLTHDYENVSYSYFDEIVEVDLPKMSRAIEETLASLRF
ncbi:MAG: DUF86 domain-containing protein [Erysipelotrichaceae bacterium]|nr:DUF86 domain-containing protein [Erysipelotrichaceae bacterium]